MSTISSGTTLTTALVQTGDTTGNLVIKTGSSNTTAMTISGSDQSVTIAGVLSVNGSNVTSSQWTSNSTAIYYNTGNVGIGTSSPATKLQVSGLTGANGLSIAARTDVADNSGNLFFTDSGGTVCIKSATGAMLFNTGATVGSGSGTERMRIDTSGNVGIGNTPSGTYKLEVSGLVSDTAGNLRSLPLNSQTSAYVAAATDNGKVISITTGGVTINNSVFSAGMVLTIYNNSGSSQTITQGAGVTMQWAGQSSSTTGSRTLGLYGMATVYFLSASSAVITGSGLT